MATFTKEILSASTNGRGIGVSLYPATNTIHTTGTSATILDEIWLYAHNTDTTARKLTIEYGGTTTPNDLIEFTVPAESGLYLIVPGLILRGTGSAGTTIAAGASASGVLNIFGYVNRITP